MVYRKSDLNSKRSGLKFPVSYQKEEIVTSETLMFGASGK